MIINTRLCVFCVGVCAWEMENDFFLHNNIEIDIERHGFLLDSERTAQQKTINGEVDEYFFKKRPRTRLVSFCGVLICSQPLLVFCFPFLKDDRVRCETSFHRESHGAVYLVRGAD